jgi:polyisoprenyl-phosphate glycosyltransferase
MSVAVVVPVYRNADTVAELHGRLSAALGAEAVSFVFVDDACPAGSAAVLEAVAAADPRVTVVSLPRNRGQHRAILAGLAQVDAEWTVVLDADLQDPPEAVPLLLARARAGGVDAVFGGRRGRYEPRLRLVTSRLFKHTLALLTGLPRDAGLFVVLHRRLVARVLALRGPEPFLTAMIACTRAPTTSVAVERAARPSGRSAYRSVDRLRAGAHAVHWLVHSRRLGRRVREESA